MNIGNVTMVSVLENFQIQKAVDLQRSRNCEMRLNVDVNVHFAVHQSTFQRNERCISLSEHPVCVLYTVDIHTQKDTHGPIVSAAQTTITVHIPKIATDTLHTELDALRTSHKQFWLFSSKSKVMPELCTALQFAF